MVDEGEKKKSSGLGGSVNHAGKSRIVVDELTRLTGWWCARIALTDFLGSRAALGLTFSGADEARSELGVSVR